MKEQLNLKKLNETIIIALLESTSPILKKNVVKNNINSNPRSNRIIMWNQWAVASFIKNIHLFLEKIIITAVKCVSE